jgi:hypothetical protein
MFEGGTGAVLLGDAWARRWSAIAQLLGWLYLFLFGLGLLFADPSATSITGLVRAFLVTAGVIIVNLDPPDASPHNPFGVAATIVLLGMIATAFF